MDFIVVNLFEFVLLVMVGYMMEFDIGLFLLDKLKLIYMYYIMLYLCCFLVVRYCGKLYLGINFFYRF